MHQHDPSNKNLINPSNNTNNIKNKNTIMKNYCDKFKRAADEFINQKTDSEKPDSENPDIHFKTPKTSHNFIESQFEAKSALSSSKTNNDSSSAQNPEPSVKCLPIINRNIDKEQPTIEENTQLNKF